MDLLAECAGLLGRKKEGARDSAQVKNRLWKEACGEANRDLEVFGELGEKVQHATLHLKVGRRIEFPFGDHRRPNVFCFFGRAISAQQLRQHFEQHVEDNLSFAVSSFLSFYAFPSFLSFRKPKVRISTSFWSANIACRLILNAMDNFCGFKRIFGCLSIL